MTKRALIVGASGGIGRGIATRLAEDGWRVLCHGRKRDALEETLRHVVAAGGEGAIFEADVTVDESLAALATWASNDGPLDAVIWSAGGGRSVSTGPECLDEWERTLAAILHGPMRLTAYTSPSVRKAQGAYLYVCGMYAKTGIAKMAAHCAARHGLEGFAKALFEEVREDGVRVTLLHPGFVYTALTNPEKLDPEKCIQVSDIAEMAALAVTLPANACVTEMIVRPQRSPYR